MTPSKVGGLKKAFLLMSVSIADEMRLNGVSGQPLYRFVGFTVHLGPNWALIP